MTRSLRTLAIAIAAVLAGCSAPAFAANQVLCAPPAASAAPGPGVVTNPVTTTSYTLNARGCAPIAFADVGYFQSQGYTTGPNLFSIQYTTGVLTGTTSVQVATLPPGAFLRDIVVDNTVAAAVTGGINFGNASAGAQIVSALTCGASCLTYVADSAVLLRVFSKTASQAVFATAQTAWNSANVTITITYSYF